LDTHKDNFLGRIILRDCLVLLLSFCTSIAGWKEGSINLGPLKQQDCQNIKILRFIFLNIMQISDTSNMKWK